MTKKYNLYQVDAFTKEKLAGNPAGVITNADGLSSDQMQKIARELNNSETAFIFQSDTKNCDVHVRFFTPTREVPICGHATIAAHYARAVEKDLDCVRVYQKTGAGILPVDVIREKGDYKIVMTQGSIIFEPPLESSFVASIVAALDINNADLMENWPVQIVSTGHSKVMIGIKNKALLNTLTPHMDKLKQISEQINCNGFYIFTTNTDNPEILVCGRMFAPAIGIPEDPVTGNANGPLGAYLVHHKFVKHNNKAFNFKALQGEAIHRAGIIDVQVKIDNQEPAEIQIAGNAVIVFKIELTL